MQQKLRSVFRRSSRTRTSSGSHEQLGSKSHDGEASSLRPDRKRVSSDRHGRRSIDSSVPGSVYTGRSRPVSSIDDDHRQSSAPAGQTADLDITSSADPNPRAIANDYKAYLPALSPVRDDVGDDYITLSKDGRHTMRESEARHNEAIANHNIARHSTSIDEGNRKTDGAAQNGFADPPSTAPIVTLPSAVVNPVPTGGAIGQCTIGGNVPTNGCLVDSVPPHTEPIEKQAAKSSSPGRDSKMLFSDNEASRVPQGMYEVSGPHPGVPHATLNRTADGEETAFARKLREDDVVDLRNTVDTDGDVTWAPAVTHEVIKPHQHEIVQEKIYREIHNYEHFHRIQPVMMTEVLPPRHWIPNPNGEGLIEISAEELPARTGNNRWWSICEHSSPYSRHTALPKYRAEPEIIEAGTFMTEEGFMRKETVIIHPPTLAELSGYGGPVQVMHFDHKTGKSWMGELTTMDKLHQLRQELDSSPDTQAFKMNGLDKALPKLSPESPRSGSTSMPHRKPVSGHSPTVHGSNVGR